MKTFNNFNIFLIIINIIIIGNYLINAQHIQCVTSNNEDGMCIALSECPSLDTLYKDNPVKTREMIAFFIKSHTICGKRNVDRQPILCCPEQINDTDTVKKTTSRSITTATSIPEITTVPANNNVNDIGGKFINVIKKDNQSTCKIGLNPENDSHSLLGNCMEIKKCPHLFNLYLTNSEDQHLIDFLLYGQRICNNEIVNGNPVICCPPEETDLIFTKSIKNVLEESTSLISSTPNDQSELKSIKCIGPNSETGICSNINDCESIKLELNKNPTNQTILSYIISSNTACNSVPDQICCPTSSSSADSELQTKLESKLLTPEENCGFSNASHTKIVGGQPAELGAWPWMALLGYADRLDEIEWKCGGSIITTKHVLTAAHCIINSLKIVRLGEHDIEKKTDTNTVDIPILKSQKHFKYSVRDGHNDIAMVYLKYPIKFTSFIKPICLPLNEPLRSTVFIGYQPFIAGWGRTQEGGKTANVLQELQIPILENVDCRDRYQRIGKLISEQQFDEAVLCAGILTGGKDSCQGDSGGPLMIASFVNRKTIYYQIGIVSYGIGCARTDVPGVYTKVQHFIDWIEEQIK